MEERLSDYPQAREKQRKHQTVDNFLLFQDYRHIPVL